MSLVQEELSEFEGSTMAMVSRKCIILLLCDDNKIRAVMEEDDSDPPAGAAWPLPAIRVFDDVDDAVVFACDGPIQDETFQIVELEDMGVYDLGDNERRQ